MLPNNYWAAVGTFPHALTPKTNILVQPDRDKVRRMLLVHFGITETELREARPTDDMTYIRYVCYYILYNYTDETCTSIQKWANRPHHSTVTRGYKIVADMLTTKWENAYKIDVRCISWALDLIGIRKLAFKKMQGN